MKVAFVLGVFPTISETFIVNQIVALIDEGVDIKIFAFNKGEFKKVHEIVLKYNLLDKVTYYNKAPRNKIKRVLQALKFISLNIFKIDYVLLLNTFNFYRFKKKALNFEEFYKKQWFILKQNFDIVHVHFGSVAIPIAQLKADGYLNKSKLVVSFHGYDVDPSKAEYFKYQYKQLFEQVTTITVNTEYTKDLLLRIKSDLKNITILPVGLDTTLFKPMLKTHDKTTCFKILFCGRLIKLKGADIAIKVIDELTKRGHNVDLTIVGSGIMQNNLISLSKQLSISHLINFNGAVSQEELIELMSINDVFLLPGIIDSENGRAEAQGLVIQEAQSMELPVIVSNVGGMKYGLLPNETGFVVKEKDIEGFANSIEYFIKNPKEAKLMGKRGREFVIKNYDSKILVNKLLSVYSKPNH